MANAAIVATPIFRQSMANAAIVKEVKWAHQLWQILL